MTKVRGGRELALAVSLAHYYDCDCDCDCDCDDTTTTATLRLHYPTAVHTTHCYWPLAVEPPDERHVLRYSATTPLERSCTSRGAQFLRPARAAGGEVRASRWTKSELIWGWG